MTYPGDEVMFLAFALCEGQAVRLVDGRLAISSGGSVTQTLPPEALGELLDRGWAEFESDAWDAPPRVTAGGRHWVERWLRSLGPLFRKRTLAEVIRYYTVRGLKGVA